MKQATITCDACGIARETEIVPGSIDGHGWFTISRVGWHIGEPQENAPPRPPDLCSWGCVAAYAQKRAGGGGARKPGHLLTCQCPVRAEAEGTP